MEGFLTLHALTLIYKDNLQAFGKESHLTEALLENVIIVYGLLKNLLVRKESNGCSCSIPTLSSFLQRIHCLAALVTLLIPLSISADGNFQPLRQCINDRSSNTVKTAGYLVSSTAEFTSGMKNSKYNLYCRNTGFMINSNRNASSVVYNCDGVIRIDCYIDFCTVTGQCLIYGIVHDFIYKVVQTAAGCTSNVHTRSLTYGFQALQNLDLVRSVFRICFAHDIPPVIIYSKPQEFMALLCCQISFLFLCIKILIYYITKSPFLPVKSHFRM